MPGFRASEFRPGAWDVPTLNRACERGMRYTSRELLDNGGLVDHRP